MLRKRNPMIAVLASKSCWRFAREEEEGAALYCIVCGFVCPSICLSGMIDVCM